jgi:hypothetical protein
LVWSSGLWVGVVVWDLLWLLLGAWGAGWAIDWSIGSGADLSGAVNSIGSVVTVASWELSSGLDNDWVPLGKVLFLLVVVEWLSLHDNVLTEILITIHTGGEELRVWWVAGDTGDSGVYAASGFLQVSACVNSGIAGVTCNPPNSELFATGMNGDEDLGEDIIMKGEPFHYN